MLKALKILSVTTTSLFAAKQENLKQCWNSERKNISRGDQNTYYSTSFENKYQQTKNTTRIQSGPEAL